MTGRLTVVQLLPALDSGGVERGTVEIGRALVRAGHRSIVVSAGGRMVDQLLADGSEHFTRAIGKKSPLSFRLIPGLRRLFAGEAVDLIHARSRVPAWLGRMAWSRLPARRRPHWVTTVHGFYSVNRYSAIMTTGEKVIAVSNAIRDYIGTNYPHCPPSAVSVIPRGVDRTVYEYGHKPSDEWLSRWYEDFPQTRERPMIAVVGRLVSGKGLDAFVRVLAALEQRGLGVAGVIVGGAGRRSNTLRGQLQNLAARLGVTGLSFTGERGDVREIMAVSALVASFSSRPESFGRTMVESLSLGIPTAGFAHGGVGEVLGNIYPQGCIENGDVDKATDRIAELLTNPIPVPRHHPYTLERMTSATIELYEQICGRPPETAG